MTDPCHGVDESAGSHGSFAHLPYEVNANKTEGIRDLGVIDLGGVREAVLAIPPQGWDRPDDFEANYNKAGAIRQASHIIFRFSDRREAPIRYSELPLWDAWKAKLLPLLEQAVRPYGYRKHFFPRVMLAKLPPGSFIAPHIDGDERGFVPHKVHIPIQSNDKAFFFLEKERHHLAVGRAYEVNNGARHSVVNGGETDRIHLIFEYLDAEAQPLGD